MTEWDYNCLAVVVDGGSWPSTFLPNKLGKALVLLILLLIINLRPQKRLILIDRFRNFKRTPPQILVI